jgi:hypothetical protein
MNVLRPDKEIPRAWADYKAGRDAVLKWVSGKWIMRYFLRA